MDDFDYDEFGNYIGPGLEAALQDHSNQLPLADDYTHANNLHDEDQHDVIDLAAQTLSAASHKERNYQHYDESVEIIVPTTDILGSHQGLMQSSQAVNLDERGANEDASAGYGTLNNYQASFCLSETVLPPITIAQQHAFPQLIHDLLSETWLQRNFSLIGGHLHGKTALLDLFFSQLHPHINIQSITPETPTVDTTPHNLKPTTSFSGNYDPVISKQLNSKSGCVPANRTRDCWPVQYADSLYRERAIGHTTALKSITLPVQIATPFLDSQQSYVSSAQHGGDLPTKTYLFSITDTPAHGNYVDPTILAIQRCSGSGVVLAVDCVEGVTAEIELQLEYAIRNASPMVLVLTKLDRLITELRIPPNEAYFKLLNVIEAINTVVSQLYTLYYGTTPPPATDQQESFRYRCPLFNPIENNVIFTSTLHSWAFTIKSFATLYLTQQEIKAQRGAGHSTSSTNSCPKPVDFNTNSTNLQKLHKLTRLFWGNVYYDPNTKQFLSRQPQPTFHRTFVEFILTPLYKMYSACLTGNASYLEAMLGSFYQPLPLAQDVAMTSDGAPLASFSPFAIPPHILASSQNDLLRQLVGLWLLAPFHLSTIHERSEGGYNDEDFSIFSSTQPTTRSRGPNSHRLPSNANYTAQLLAATILDSLPPPAIRKAFVQQTTLLYQPQIILGSAPKLAALPSQQSTLSQTHPQTKTSNAQLQTLQLPTDKFFPPCRVALADVITAVPHPNGTTFDLLCRVHTLSLNNDPSFVDQEEDQNPHGTSKSRIAFRIGDKVTLFRTEDKSYSTPHHLVGIFASCANRYRVPLNQCYDGNLVVLSFSTQSTNPGSQPIDPLLSFQQTDTQLLQKFHLSGHGTLINHTITPLGNTQRQTRGSTRIQSAAVPAATLQLDHLDIKNFIPTFTPPLVHPGADVFNISIEPTVVSELPMLLAALQRAQCIYGSSLKVVKQASGTHTLAMRGEFLADDIIHYLRVVTGNLSIASTFGQQQRGKVVPPNLSQLSFSISAPFYTFREGVREQSQIQCKSSSIGGYNSISATAHNLSDGRVSNILPDQQQYADQVETHADNLHYAKQYHHYLNCGSRGDSLHITEPTHLTKSMNSASKAHIEAGGRNPGQRTDRESIIFGSNRLFSTYHGANKIWDKLAVTQTPWSFGLFNDANVELLDDVARGAYNRSEDDEDGDDFGGAFLRPSEWKFDHVAALVNGFNRLALEGPLTESSLQNTSLRITGLSISRNPLHATSRHLIPTIRKSLSGAMLLAEPTLYEPMIRGEVIMNPRFEPELLKTLGSRRGAVLSTTFIPLTPYSRYVYKLPALESVGFGIEARLITKGQSRLSGGYHLSYEMMQGDPLDANIPVSVLKVAAISDLQRELFVKTRRRKGLPEFEIENYFDSEMLSILETNGEDEQEE